MPSRKAKTHKGVKKRFKVTATGKVMHKPCGSSHLNSSKSGGQIRKMRRPKALKVGKVAQKLRRAVRTNEVIRDVATGVELVAPPAATVPPTPPKSAE